MLSKEFCEVFNRRIHFLSQNKKKQILESNKHNSEYEVVKLLSKMAEIRNIKNETYLADLNTSLKKIEDFNTYFKIMKNDETLKIENILDIGGADGSLGAAVATTLNVELKKVVLLDINPQPIEDYMKQGMTYLHSSADQLPISDKTTDLCLLSMVLHHLETFDMKERCLREIFRCLKPGGYLLIREHDIHDHNEVIFDYIHLLFSAVLTKEATIEDAYRMKQDYITYDELIALLSEIGFIVVRPRIFQNKGRNINEAYGLLVQKPK